MRRLNKYLSLLSVSVMTLGLCACEESSYDVTEEKETTTFGLVASRNGESDTYRILFFNSNDNLSFYNSSTYKAGDDIDDSEIILQPCALADDGTIDPDAPNAYFHPAAGSYQVVCVSPGIKCEKGVLKLTNADFAKKNYGKGKYDDLWLRQIQFQKQTERSEVENKYKVF